MQDDGMNMRSVALRAGVSSATVSRVINGSPAVKDETAERVRRVIEELNFLPNPVATTLKRGRSNTFGLIIPDITNPFYPEFLRDFEEILVENDHEILLANTRSSAAALLHSIRRMLLRRVDGVVLMSSEFDTEAIEPLLAQKVPIVTIDRRHVEEGISDVAIDFEGGFLAGVDHLRRLGHERIAYVGGTDGLRTSRVRLKAFERALKACGLPLDAKLLAVGDYRVNGGDQATEVLLRQRSRPTAIMTANDLTAFGVLRALHHAKLDVPGTMSVIGLDDILLSDVLQPPLTTIRISRRTMAETCLKALDYTKNHLDQRGRQFSVSTTLLVRESTAAPVR